MISILLYTNDVWIATTEEGLQKQLDTLHAWTLTYRMTINMDKMKVVHFRKVRKGQTKKIFKLGMEVIGIATDYKYLSLSLDQHLSYKHTT